MQFGLLGPLEVIQDGRSVPVRSGKHRALLAALLLRPNRPVSLGELVDVIWGENPPANPRNAVHTYVARTRAVIGDAIQTTSDGYRVAVDALDVDLGRFDALLYQADRHAERGDPGAEAESLREALRLWRGEALADVPSDLLHREVVPQLRERRLLALERRIGIDLHQGRHAELVGELTTLTAQYPLRERLWAQLITALHDGGRRADALAAYQTVRRKLADELGIDPGAELQELYAVVLAGRSESDTLRTSLPPVPRQLPPGPHQFTGRSAELAELDALLRGADSPAGAVVISAIAGTAGVGKSALAAHWARRAADEFPDGQLWLNLRGYDPGRLVPPEQALTVLLRALGVPAIEIPLDLDGRTGLYRSLLDGRRTLIVLDNAGSAEQVRPLLPGAPGCFVVVTSRDDLAGLVVRDGATRVRLDLLTREESVALLRRLLGSAVDGHPDTVDRLVRLCARLPLALRIAADRIVTDGAPLPVAVDGLARGGTLDTFAAGDDDPYTALRAVFSWSYEALPAPTARMFRLVGLVPGDDWDIAAAAALAGCPAAEARRLLAGLASAHLVEERNGPRYGMHDLLRVYATELADRDPDRDAAWRRLCDHYLGTVMAAAERAFPSQLGLSRPALPSATTFADADAAVGWLDANRAGIVAVSARAAEAGPLAVAWQLADVLAEYFLINRHTAEARTTGEAGLAAARRASDLRAEAMMRYRLGALGRIVDDYPSARAHHQAALDLFGGIGDPDGQVAATIGLGTVCADVGELAQARDLLGDGAARARRRGLTDLAGIAFGALFNVHHSDGDLRATVTAVTEAEQIFRATANGRRLTPTLINRAVSLHMIGEYDQALEVVTEGLALSRRYGQRHYEASAQVVLALVALDVGKPDRALEHASEGLRLIQAVGLKEYEGAAWSALGWVYWVLGKYHHAVEHHTRCLEFGRETGFLLSELQGHIGLASSHHRLGNLDIALDHARRAMYHARERQFLLSECEISQLLAVISAEQGDPLAAEHHMARADQIMRDTGFRPAPYMPKL